MTVITKEIFLLSKRWLINVINVVLNFDVLTK